MLRIITLTISYSLHQVSAWQIIIIPVLLFWKRQGERGEGETGREGGEKERGREGGRGERGRGKEKEREGGRLDRERETDRQTDRYILLRSVDCLATINIR